MSLENKKKEYNNLLNRFLKAEKWFYNQDNSYFNGIEDKKEYKAFKEIIRQLNNLYNEREAVN